MHLRRGNLNIGASPCQLHQTGCQLSLEYSAEDRVSLFRNVAMQDLKDFVTQAGKLGGISTIQSSLRLDIDTALMVTSGIFRSRDVTDLPSLAVVMRI